MKMLKGFLVLGALALLPACASFSPTAVLDKEASPREQSVLLADTVGPPVAALATLCETEVLSEDTAELVLQYGPPVRVAIGAVAASARDCVVLGGTLQSDPATTGECFRGTYANAGSALPSALLDIGSAVGGETGQNLVIASAVVRSILRTSPVDVGGYPSDLDDIPIGVYDATWSPIQQDANTLFACASRE